MTAIKTLLLSGANNHDWERSTPFFAGLLRDSGRFDVTVTEDPSLILGGRLWRSRLGRQDRRVAVLGRGTDLGCRDLPTTKVRAQL